MCVCGEEEVCVCVVVGRGLHLESINTGLEIQATQAPLSPPPLPFQYLPAEFGARAVPHFLVPICGFAGRRGHRRCMLRSSSR